MKYVKLFEEFASKDMLGKGYMANVYPSKTHPDRVIKKYRDDEETESTFVKIKYMLSVQPDVLPKIFSIDDVRKIIVMEKVTMLTNEDVINHSSFIDVTVPEFSQVHSPYMSSLSEDSRRRSIILELFETEWCIGEFTDIKRYIVLESQMKKAITADRDFWMGISKVCSIAAKHNGGDVDAHIVNIGKTKDDRYVLVDF